MMIDTRVNKITNSLTQVRHCASLIITTGLENPAKNGLKDKMKDILDEVKDEVDLIKDEVDEL